MAGSPLLLTVAEACELAAHLTQHVLPPSRGSATSLLLREGC